MRDRTPEAVRTLVVAAAVVLVMGVGAGNAGASQLVAEADDAGTLSLTGFVGIAAIVLGMAGLAFGLVRRTNRDKRLTVDVDTADKAGTEEFDDRPTAEIPHQRPASRLPAAAPRR
jgi:hypothetical protein